MDLLLNGSVNHTNDCHEGPTSHKTLQIVVLIRSGVAGVSFIMSVIACLLIITRQCSRTLGYKLSTSTIERLFIYLLITSILYSLACVFQFVVILLNSSKPNAPSCQISGFFTIFFNWTFTLMSFCVTLHLLIYSIMHGNIDKRKKWLKRFEVFYLIFTFFGPFLFVFWPFLHGYYGLDGTWCFIHSTSGNCITDIIGVIEQLFIWYVWKILLTLFALIMLVFITCRIIRMKKRSVTIIALLCYIVLHVISAGVAILVRALASWITNNYILPLGILYSVVDPCQCLAAALIVFVHLCCTRSQPESQDEKTHLITLSEKTTE